MLRFTVCLLLMLPAIRGDRLFSEEQPEAFLETLPAGSRISLTIRNLEELDAQYKQHIRQDESFSPKRLISLGLGLLGVRQGVDWEGTFSASLMDWGEGEINDDKLEFLVVRIPFDNVALMGNNFGLNKLDDLVPEKIHRLEKRLGNRQDLYLTFREHHVLLSMRREAIEQYLSSKPMKSVVTSDPGGRLSGSDVLVQVNPRELQPDRYDQQVERWIKETFRDEPDENRDRVRLVLRHLEKTFFCMKIDRGVHIRVQCCLSPDLPAELEEMLETYAQPSTLPGLNGFPKGNLLLALSKAADREQNETIRNRSIAWLLEQTIQNKSISGLVLPYLDPRGDTFHGLIDEIWNSIVEARSAVYLNENMKEDGMGNLLVILRPDHPEGFTDRLASLVKFSRGAVYNPRTQKADKVTDEEIQQLIEQLGAREFKVRKAATLRLNLLGEPALQHLEQSALSKDEEVARRSKSLLLKIREKAAHHAQLLIQEGLTALPLPEFVFYENQRTIEGFPADVLVANWEADDPVNSKRVRELAGPRGDEILIVHVDEQVVLFWGSDRTVLSESLRLLESGAPGLNEQRERFAAYAAPRRIVETHLSVQKFARMVPESFRRKLPDTAPTEDFSSFGVEITPRHLIGDASFPLPEFVLIARYFFLF